MNGIEAFKRIEEIEDTLWHLKKLIESTSKYQFENKIMITLYEKLEKEKNQIEGALLQIQIQ